MKENKLVTLSVEELINKEKKLKQGLGVLIGAIAVLFVACIILTVMKGFQVFTVLPVAFLPIVIASFTNLKEVQQEIKSRSI